MSKFEDHNLVYFYGTFTVQGPYHWIPLLKSFLVIYGSLSTKVSGMSTESQSVFLNVTSFLYPCEIELDPNGRDL